MIAPFDWLYTPAHYQGLSLALGVALIASCCTVVLNGAAWSTALVGIASAMMFTVISLPLAQIYWNLQWPWWLVIGAVWGVVSVFAMRSLIKAAERVYQRTPDIVDGSLKRVLPDTPGGS